MNATTPVLSAVTTAEPPRPSGLSEASADANAAPGGGFSTALATATGADGKSKRVSLQELERVAEELPIAGIGLPISAVALPVVLPAATSSALAAAACSAIESPATAPPPQQIPIGAAAAYAALAASSAPSAIADPAAAQADAAAAGQPHDSAVAFTAQVQSTGPVVAGTAPVTPPLAELTLPAASEPAAAPQLGSGSKPAAEGKSRAGESTPIANLTAGASTTPAVAPATVVVPISVSADARGRGRDSRDESLPSIELRTRAEAGADGAAMSIAKLAEAGDAQAPTLLKLHERVDTPEFGQALAERVTWLVQKDLNGAKLSVNPPQLGPIEVRIEVKDDQASVWFSTHSAVTRDALESSTAKLREMLDAQGFTAVSVDISHRSFQERASYPTRYDWAPADATAAEPARLGDPVETRPQARSALDIYA